MCTASSFLIFVNLMVVSIDSEFNTGMGRLQSLVLLQLKNDVSCFIIITLQPKLLKLLIGTFAGTLMTVKLLLGKTDDFVICLMNLFAFCYCLPSSLSVRNVRSLGSHHHSVPRVTPCNWLLLLLYHLLSKEKEIGNLQTWEAILLPGLGPFGYVDTSLYRLSQHIFCCLSIFFSSSFASHSIFCKFLSNLGR